MIQIIKKNSSLLFLLLIIFVVAFLFRVVRLSEYPVGFHIDEASLGYNAYSLLLTGRDEANHALPLYIDTFGDNRPSGYFYLTIPSVAVFGLNEFATRFPGALFGTLGVFAIFALSYSIFQNKKVSIIASLLYTISPWNIVLSRASAETIVALFFIMSGFASIIWSMQKKKRLFLVVGVLLLALSFFFYHTPRVFVPMLFFFFLLYLFPVVRKFKETNYKVWLLGSFLILSFISFALIFLVSGGTGRFNQVNIFGFPETKLVMNEQIREDGTEAIPPIIAKAFHNKLINYSLTFARNYFEYFSGGFLFMQGGLPNWYKVDQMGLIYLVEFPFLLYGLYALAKQNDRTKKLAIIWLLVAPITAAITVDDIPNLQRAIVLFPMIEIIVAYGFLAYVEKYVRFKKIIIIIAVVLLACNLLYFLHQYFIHSRTHRPWKRNNGFAEMMQEVNKVYDQYDKIIITKTAGGYPLVLFFSKYDPFQYQHEGSPKDKDFSGFGKYIFVPNGCPSRDGSPAIPVVKKKLFVDSGDCPNTYNGENGKQIPIPHKTKEISKEDGTAAFRIIYE